MSTLTLMRTSLIFLFLSVSGWAQAQMKEGKVVYEHTIQLQFRPQNVSPEIANNLPRTRTERFELSFANNQSLWQMLPDMNEGGDQMVSAEGGRVMMRFGSMGADDVVYHNFESGRRVDQRELASKNYIVEDSIRKLNWKLGNETKTVLTYTARKATAQRISTRMTMTMENGEMKRQEVPDTSVITAWFTTDIPVPAGPVYQGQLPGLILELDINGGRDVYRALEVAPKVNASGIKEPKGGKRISAEDYAKERSKVMEEMRRNMPPPGQGRTIRVMN